MNRLLGIIGKVAAAYAVLMLVSDGFGDDLEGSDVSRLAAAAVGGALLGISAWNRGAWEGFSRGAGGDLDLTAVAKHAIDSDAQRTAGT